MNNEHIAQTLNYIKLADSQIGIIVNFQNKSLTQKRLVI
ncbi:MAG: GxxExxY protein [Bacteroidota bacterium]